MKLVEYSERSARLETIENCVLDLDTGKWEDLKAYPVYSGINPGEIVCADFRTLVAPSCPGSYELWHVVHGSSHWSYEFRKENCT